MSGEAARRPFSNAQRATLVAGFIVVTAAVAGTRLADTPGWIRFFDNVHWTAGYLAGFVVAFLGWRAAEGATRRSRGFFALALGCLTFGQFLWDVQVFIGWNPFPGPSDVGFLSMGLFLGLGLLTHLLGLPSGERRAALLDSAGIGVLALALTLALYLPRRGDLDALTTCVLVAYPVLLLADTGIALVVILARRLRPTAWLALFLAGVFSQGLLWMDWNWRTLENTLGDGILLNYLFSYSALLLGAGAAVWKAEGEESLADNSTLSRPYAVVGNLLPLALVLAASIAVAFSGLLSDVAQWSVQVGVAAVVVLAALRQSLSLRERDRLLDTERRLRETEERSAALQSQLARAQRLESLGTLAGGIAHDFNNILTAIYGNAQLAHDSATAPEIRDALDSIVSASQRGRDVVRRILAFSRDEAASMQSVAVRDLGQEVLRLLRAVLPSSIELVFTAPEALPAVRADPAQLHQVLMNLATNASHAIGARPGRIELAFSERRLRDGEVPGLSAGPFVQLALKDDGVGMDEATRARIFEPFFTTKGPSGGTGLGLSVVHGIVTAHRGSIEVESTPGHGALFRVLLPVLIAEPVLLRTPSPEAQVPTRGNGREVLIVDDEEQVGAVLTRILASTGWRGLAMQDPAAALEFVRAEPRRFAFVITDLTMPGMTGDLFAARLKEFAPALPIVLCSGNELQSVPVHFSAVLPKPYSKASVAEVLYRIFPGRDPC